MSKHLINRPENCLIGFYILFVSFSQNPPTPLDLIIPQPQTSWSALTVCCNCVTASGHGDLVTAIPIMFRVLSSPWPALPGSVILITQPQTRSSPSTGAMLRSRRDWLWVSLIGLMYGFRLKHLTIYMWYVPIGICVPDCFMFSTISRGLIRNHEN